MRYRVKSLVVGTLSLPKTGVELQCNQTIDVNELSEELLYAKSNKHVCIEELYEQEKAPITINHDAHEEERKRRKREE